MRHFDEAVPAKPTYFDAEASGKSLFSGFRNEFEIMDLFGAGACQRRYNHGVKAFPRTGSGSRLPHREVEWLHKSGNLQRWLMTPIEIVGVLFGIFAIGLIILLIYKSTLTMHEDDQLFLDEANSHLQEEQTELLTKVNRLTLPVRVFSIGSGVFLLAFLALLIYQKLNEVQ
jgi:hypothetical protein